jgi:serine/threonine-protein kinase
MRRNTPLITLLTGGALGIILLIASMLATPSKAGYGAATTATPVSTGAAVQSSSAAASSVSTAAAPSTGTASANAAARADYAGRVKGDPHASVAVSIHGSQAIAYVCNGSVVEAWLKGTAVGGRLVMTGKDGAQLSAKYNSRRAFGDVSAHGIHYSFSVYTVHKPSGLYQAIANVRGARIKAGWIVLPDGTQVGSLESNADAAAPSATQAPALDVAAGTAQDGDTVLHVTPVSGVTGSGF